MKLKSRHLDKSTVVEHTLLDGNINIKFQEIQLLVSTRSIKMTRGIIEKKILHILKSYLLHAGQYSP